MSEQLAQEVARFGIRVAIIEPGLTKSAIFAKNTDATEADSDYEPHLRRMFQFYAAGCWDAIFPGEVPLPTEKVLPQLLDGDTIDLEGSELRIIRIGQADTAESTVVHVPSLAAVVTWRRS